MKQVGVWVWVCLGCGRMGPRSEHRDALRMRPVRKWGGGVGMRAVSESEWVGQVGSDASERQMSRLHLARGRGGGGVAVQ